MRKRERLLKDKRILKVVLNKQTKTKYDQVMTLSQIIDQLVTSDRKFLAQVDDQALDVCKA